MKKVKLVFWLIVLGLVGLSVYQNLDFLLEKYKIGIDIGLVGYHTPELPVAVYLLAFFFIGVLISLFSNLAYRYRTKKTIRSLTDEVNSERRKVSDLEAKLVSSGAHSAVSATAPAKQSEPDGAGSS